MLISDEQSRQIARTIVFDIHAYIENNRADYERWLKEEDAKENLQRKEATKNADTRRIKTKSPMDSMEVSN